MESRGIPAATAHRDRRYVRGAVRRLPPQLPGSARRHAPAGKEIGLSPSDPDATTPRDLAVSLTRGAGDLLTTSRAADLLPGTKSSPTDLVTVMDRAAERLILDGLRDATRGRRACRRKRFAGRQYQRALDRRPARRHGELLLRHPRLACLL